MCDGVSKAVVSNMNYNSYFLVHCSAHFLSFAYMMCKWFSSRCNYKRKQVDRPLKLACALVQSVHYRLVKANAKRNALCQCEYRLRKSHTQTHTHQTNRYHAVSTGTLKRSLVIIIVTLNRRTPSRLVCIHFFSAAAARCEFLFVFFFPFLFLFFF